MHSQKNPSFDQTESLASRVGASTTAPRLAVSIVEAAKALGLSRSTVYKLLDQGELGSVYVGKRHLIPIAALHAFMAGLMGEAKH